jgi:hypothetical protein
MSASLRRGGLPLMTDTGRLDFLARTGATLGPAGDSPPGPVVWWCCYVPDHGIATGGSPRDAVDRMAGAMTPFRLGDRP